MEKESIGKKAKDLWEKHMKNANSKAVQWRKLLIAFSMIFVLGIAGFIFYQSGFSYRVTLNGEEVGFVKEEEMVEEALILVEEDMMKKYGEKAYFNEEVEVDRVRGHKDDLASPEELGERISQNIEVYRPASVILVDGQEEVAVDSKEKAEAILEEIKRPYIKDKKDKNIEVLKVSFKQKVEIIAKDVPVKEILSRAQAIMALGVTNDRARTYKVSRGDTAWGISRSFNMRTEEIEKANPGKDIEKLKPGDEINLVVPESLLEVVSVERHKDTEDIDFETEEKNDPSIYRGEKKVKSEGKKGKKEIITEVTFVNGVETKRKVKKETVIEEPENKVVLVGTKERPRPRPAVRGSAANRRPAPTYNGNLGAAIVATAKHYLGTPYRTGGSSPATGFDCSGFTSYVYSQYGISIPRTSWAQASYGGYVPRSQLRPGDIVAFPGHVGIYVGNNQYIHSPQTGDVVKISSLSGRRLLGGRRPY
ncbi:MAG TPA: LysM peptidoglycan-binding domain-containing protein [Tepidimicrobium sp.]|nr:LysM peptidoglycan-binding domain-containing protein [Tepidimicrobium sp.]